MLALKLALPMIAFILIAAGAVVLFIVTGVDLWVGLVVVFAPLLLVAWYIDRKGKREGRVDP